MKKTPAEVRSDFDRIALAGEGGSDRYDRYLIDLVPDSALDVRDIGSGTGRLSRGLRRVRREARSTYRYSSTLLE